MDQPPVPVVTYGGVQPHGPPTVIQTVSQPPPVVQRSETLPYLPSHRVLGIIQMVAGSLCLLLSILGFIVGHPYGFLYGSGIYTGILIILAGLFGYLAYSKTASSKGFIVACMVVNIIATCTIIVGISFASLEFAVYSYLFGYDQTGKVLFQRVKCGIVITICVFEFVVTIVHAAFTCATCCECCVHRQVVHPPAQVTGAVVVHQMPAGQVHYQQGQMPQQQFVMQQPMHVGQQLQPQQQQSYLQYGVAQNENPQQGSMVNPAFAPDSAVGTSVAGPPAYVEAAKRQ